MAKHRRFKLHTADQLRELLCELSLDLPVDDDVSILGHGLEIGSRHLANRMIVNPMEGFDASNEGTPGQLSFRRYRRYAEGGAALIWMEATAVVPEGRSNPHQFWMHEENVDVFGRLVRETKDQSRRMYGYEPVMVLQMTHSGRYSKPTGTPAPMTVQHNPLLDPIHGLAPDRELLRDEYLDELRERFVEAAGLAAEAGFDGVGVKSCHRYLVSELHSSFLRPGRYGGSLENRTRLLRESLAGIAKRFPELLVTTRLNVYDAMEYPYGFGVDRETPSVPDLEEPKWLVGELRDIGVKLLNVSIGNPYFNPHVNRPYDFPISGMNVPDEHPLVGVSRFVHAVAEVQQSYPELPVIGSGYSWLRHLLCNVAAGVLRRKWATLIGQGRGAFAYPDSVRDIMCKGEMDPAKCCITCSACTQIMRDGGQTGCVVRDSAVYGPKYREARRFAMDRLREEALRCRDCEEATCTRLCPAGVDVPSFIRAFADGNIEKSYEILRRSNVLPEMCAEICPSAEQCRAGCLEKVFCDNPIAIHDIQREVARLARLKGMVGVRLPETKRPGRIAVVGGGPAGVACAVGLLEQGFSVSIYEKSDELGGIPNSVIPEFRYADAREEIQAVLGPATEAGRLTVLTGRTLGENLGLAELREEYDAVMLAFGLPEAVSVVQGDGCLDAFRFLRAVKSGELTEMPEKVAVLGGGNSAMDAATLAVKRGARDVYLVYRRSFAEMPAWEEERDAFLNSGGHLVLLTQPLECVFNSEGKLVGLVIVRTVLGKEDASGRRRPVVVPDSESVLDVDLVIQAVGQQVPEEVLEELSELDTDESGLIVTRNGSAETGIPGVYAAGDIVNGGTTAARAVAEGMKAAAEIGEFL